MRNIFTILKATIVTLLIIFIGSTTVYSQCISSYNAGTAISNIPCGTPSGTYNMGSGTYVQVNGILNGAQYYFASCGSPFNSILTLTNTSNSVITSATSGCPSPNGTDGAMTWTANFSGSVRLHMNVDGCLGWVNGSQGSGILSYHQVNNLNITSSGSAMCPGVQRTLTATPAGGTFTGTGVSGNTFTAPAAAGNYTITYTYGACSTTKTIQVYQPASSPSSAVASPNPICPGQTTTLNVVGGSLGNDGSVWRWYNGGSCGGSSIGSGTSTNVSPSSSTVYSVRATSGSCASTSCVQVSVTVNTNSSVTSASNSGPICIGDNATLTVNGTLGTGAQWQWFTGGCNSTLVTTTTQNSITVSPSTSTTYYVRATGTCNTTGCVSTAVVVNPLPAVAFAPIPGSYCIDNSTPLNLTGYVSPSGGSFSGTGVVSNTFVPSLGAVGSNTITYTYTDGNGCTNTATSTVTVTGLPLVSFSGLGSQYCVSSSTPVSLTGFPQNSGGVFTGAGISDNGNGTATFVPSSAGSGVHNITYTYTDGNGCIASQTQSVNVLALPAITFSGLASAYCVSNAPVTLTGFPTGGTFSGPGISSNSFDPGAAGTGTHTITYSYTDGNGCSNTTTQSVTVNALPNVSFSGLGSAYCVDASNVTLTGSPSGGTFSGQGIVNGNTFNPSAAGVGGPYTITYTYTNGNGCTNTQSQTVTVNALPNVSFSGLASEYCINSPFAALTGSPSGGTFTGPGASGNNFFPSLAGAGTHIITYTYTDGNGCTNSTTKTVIVHPLPVISFLGLATAYCVDHAAITLTGSQAPLGSFSGAGITDNGNGTASFDPSTAGAGGPYTITYSFTDANGCSNTTTQSVTVNPLPVVTFSGLAASYCVDANTAPLVGSPGGGAFSGPGITGNNFIPSLAGVGVHNVTYTYTDVNGCVNSETQTVTVTALPLVGFSGLALQYCVDASSVTMTGNPTGGTFTGPGVSGSAFDPAVAGVGSHTITYTYTDGNTCTNSISQTVVVNPLPVVSFLGLPTQVCLDGSVSTLTGTPSGGTFSGPGVSGNSFNPSVAGSGTHTITYSYTDGNFCTNTSTQTVVVDTLPVVSFSGLLNVYCEDASPVLLTGSPAGGVYSGNGISGNTFYPNIAGVGTHTIIYVYTDGNSCNDADTQTVTVNPLPVVSFTGLATEYCVNDAPVTLSGTPTGGLFGGPGVSGNSFDPSIAGAGTHSITYTYTDGNNCTAVATQIVIVHPLPQLAFSGLAVEYCVDNSPVTLLGNQVPNGTFSGLGITDNGNGTASFDPSSAGVGSHDITYTYTDGNTCTNSVTNTVIVHDLPVVSFTGLAADYCVDASAVVLTGNHAPAGSFSGLGVTDNNDGTASFDPAVAGAGTHMVMYSYTDGNACVNIDTQIVVVNPLPVVSFTGLASAYCVDATPVTLSGTPSGGVFSGPGTSGNSFDPAVAGVGTHTVTYTYTDGNGCVNFSSQQVVVNALPIVNYTGFSGTYCVDNTNQIILSGTPIGGTFSGPGISGAYFTPSVAGVGSHSVIYTHTDINGCTNADTQIVVVNDLPVVSFTGLGNAYCEDDVNPVTLTGSPTGGAFSGPGISGSQFTAQVAGPGTHDIVYTYTDGNLCTNTSTVQVDVNPLPVVSFTGLAAGYCVNAAPVTLTGSPFGGAFSGSGIINGDQFDPATAGAGSHDITYTYTDGNQCRNSVMMTVVVYALPVVTVTPNGPTSICAGASVTLNANAGFTQYAWSNNQYGQSLPVSQAGSYVVTVTDNHGCQNASAPVNIVVNPLPVVDLGPDTIICNNASITLDAGGGNTTYAWSTQANTQTISVSQTGLYTVTVTDPNGCVNSDAIGVTIASLLQPTVTSSGSTTFCDGQSVTLDAGTGYAQYLWSSTAETTQTITATQAGTYSVMVTDSMGCNGFSAPVVVTVLPLPQPFIVPDGPTEFCVGESVTLNAGVGYNGYLWSTNHVTSSIVVDTQGVYNVTVTGSNGCQNVSPNVNVIVHQLPNPTITADGPTEFCYGGSVVLDVGSGYASYLWSSGSPTQSITVTETGDYSVVVIDGNGCLDSSLNVNPVTVTVWDPQPTIQVVGNTFTCAPAFASYQWYLNNAMIPGATQQTFIAPQSGNYHVVVNDDNGCEGESQVIEHTWVGIGDVANSYSMELFPNPTNSVFNMKLEFAENTDVRIQLSDLLGQLIIPVEDVPNVRTVNRKYNLNHLPNGIYVMQVVTTNGSIVKRIIKE